MKKKNYKELKLTSPNEQEYYRKYERIKQQATALENALVAYKEVSHLINSLEIVETSSKQKENV